MIYWSTLEWMRTSWKLENANRKLFPRFSRTQKLIEINILLPKIIVIYEARGMWSSGVHKSAGKIICHSRWWDLSHWSEISLKRKQVGYNPLKSLGRQKKSFSKQNSIAKLSIKQFQSNQMVKRENKNPTANFIDTLATFLLCTIFKYFTTSKKTSAKEN